MSAGHDHGNWFAADTGKLNRVLESREYDQWRWTHRPIDDSFDLPYLGGYSQDGKTIYIDRHLPQELKIGRRLIRPRDFIRLHEEMEKYLIDMLEWPYAKAHPMGNAAERRAVLSEGIFWDSYRLALDPFIKADAHEKLEKVPADLDMTPYLAPPVDRKLISRMRRAMGEEKREKNDPEVNYSDTRGYPRRHCGPDSDWPRGFCEHYGNHDCALVEGYIEAKGGCDLWEQG